MTHPYVHVKENSMTRTEFRGAPKIWPRARLLSERRRYKMIHGRLPRVVDWRGDPEWPSYMTAAREFGSWGEFLLARR